MNIWQILKTNKAAQKSESIRSMDINPANTLQNECVECRVRTPFIEFLPDWQLNELNQILNWNCFTADLQGRHFGKAYSDRKRQFAQEVPDHRIELMDRTFDLKTKRVLEVGCFEGVHTVALAQRSKFVVAIDSRIENVVKTMVRVGFFGQTAHVLCCNVEDLCEDQKQYLKSDLVHHVGVLYHLKDPVSHLISLKELAPAGIMLDSHYALPEMADKTYKVGNEVFRYHKYREPGGYKGVFSGMYDHAKWLTLEDLTKALKLAGYGQVELLETRVERNGPRLLLIGRP